VGNFYFVVLSQMFELCAIITEFIGCPYVVKFSWILFTKH